MNTVPCYTQSALFRRLRLIELISMAPAVPRGTCELYTLHSMASIPQRKRARHGLVPQHRWTVFVEIARCRCGAGVCSASASSRLLGLCMDALQLHGCVLLSSIPTCPLDIRPRSSAACRAKQLSSRPASRLTHDILSIRSSTELNIKSALVPT